MKKNICDHHDTQSTTKQIRKEVDVTDGRSSRAGTSTAQIARHNAREKVALHNSCACGSTKGFLGAGRRPREESISCSECRKFIEYRLIEKLKRQRKRKRLTDCLEILGDSGIQGDEALFILSNLGGECNA